jgi:iron(III) transport system permease protein
MGSGPGLLTAARAEGPVPDLATIRIPARRPRRPVGLLVVSGAVAVALLLPLALLILQAVQYGWSAVAPLIFRQLTATLLWHTLSLLVVVTAICAVVGTLAAWCVERTNLPGRRMWAVLVVIPVGIPDFAVAFGWKSIFVGIGGFAGSVLVMSLAVYPLVYLPVAASLRNADPGQEEVARSLGVGRLKTFWRVTLGQARLAVLGGCVLVALMILSEYGAFEFLGYRTLTTEIFTEAQVGFNAPAACALSLLLVGLGMLFLTAEGVSRGSGRANRVGPMVARPAQPYRLGRATIPVVGGFTLLVATALGVPIGAIIYWMFKSGTSTLPAAASVTSAAVHTALYSGGAGLIAMTAALPMALLSVRHPGRGVMALERSTYLVLAVPGVVIALSFTYALERYAAGTLYQSSLVLMVAYAIMFFPLALVAVRASVARAPVGLEEVGRSLGKGRLSVLARVTLPLLAPGLAAAFCLVFLESVTELTATLLLRPTNTETLATQFWAFTSNVSYHQAAPYAAVMVAVAAVPSYMLGRWFDRMPAGAGGTAR